MRALGLTMLTGLSLMAHPREDFRALTQVAAATYPNKTHYAVVCDYRASKGDIETLANALGSGFRITVVDLHYREQIGAAGMALLQRRPDLLVLLPHDPVVRDGNLEATWLIHTMKARNLTTVSTRAVALRQGAAWAIGEGTNGELMVDPALKGTIDVILPEEYKRSRQAFSGGKAEVSVAKL